MDSDVIDTELVARLRRLDAASASAAPQFDYQDMLERRAARQARMRRRQHYARGTAAALLVVLIGASFWRLDHQGDLAASVGDGTSAAPVASEPRIVRADTYLAVAELEDHIASIDDALNVARIYAPRGAEVARLEQTRAELVDSYARVRYAEMVSANF